MRLSPKPCSTSHAATAPGVVRLCENAAAARPARREARASRPGGRAALRSVACSSGQASRAAASENEDCPGTTVISSGGHAPGERRADAEEHRIAGREHADAASAHRRDRFDEASIGEGQARRSAPFFGSHREMALAADQHLRGVDQRARRRRQARRPRPRRCRRSRATASSRAAEDDGVQRGGRDGAAAATAVKRDEGKAEAVFGERSLRFRRADEADRKAEHGAGRAAPSATSSRSRKSAVGALPITTTAPW